MPRARHSSTIALALAGAEGSLTTGTHPDGQLSEVVLRLGKQGSTLAGLAEAFSVVTSLALQYGAPVDLLVEHPRGLRFEPAGPTDDEEIPQATSVVDYVARRLALDYPTRH
jgi:ribonucleoside-diphosphate reductase alpha chain